MTITPYNYTRILIIFKNNEVALSVFITKDTDNNFEKKNKNKNKFKNNS